MKLTDYIAREKISSAKKHLAYPFVVFLCIKNF